MLTMKERNMKKDSKSENHAVVAHDQWIAARKAFLAKEKEFTRLRDELSRQRRELPWELVEKPYVFDGPSGKETLADLFTGRSQLIVHHFMFGPDWDVGCKSCSFWADNYDGIGIHLEHRDISFVTISRAPLPTLEAYRQRMGWRFKWVSSLDNDFNFDFNASFTKEEIEDGTAFWNFGHQRPGATEVTGISVFCKDKDGQIFHTYSCFQRGVDLMNSAYNYMDLAPKGRNEADQNPTMAWLRRHDEYED